MSETAGPEIEGALFTDLYELTMAASYFAHGCNREATFELFVRSLPEPRNFLVACGLDDVLTYLEGLRFSAVAIDHLATVGLFRDDFLAFLADLRFTGDVRAVPEGEVVFANEPIVEVTAPLIEAQIIETFLINQLAFQTMVASKAARVAIACGERRFVDFSARRDHGIDAAMKAARAATVGGAVATSLVEAGRRYSLPVTGTMAHSYVMSFEDEREAFRAYARDFPDHATFLIDTFDTIEGARVAAEVARELAAQGVRVRGVRLDSGDLAALAKQVRVILDDAGLPAVEILASGDLDEYRIAELVAAGAPIDAFGVGTRLGTSHDAPSLGVVYKLVEDHDGPKMKLSEGKMTLPGRKQIYRFDDHDVIALADSFPLEGRPLLARAMASGVRLVEGPRLSDLRDRCRRAVAALPPDLRELEPVAPYEVNLADDLQAMVAELSEDLQ
ncbi:MAG: nicotinate phosphoribosyltransferase [Acidimicrobiales bacterium]